MEYRILPWILVAGCSAVACILWFFLADRRRNPDEKSLSLSGLILLLGILFGIIGARVLYVLFRINNVPLFGLKIKELSYYGGMAGVVLAVILAARILGRRPLDVLNTFAPMGAFLAAMFRFAEGFLGTLGFGAYLESGVFFPVTVEVYYDEYYSEFYWAVFMLEGLFSLIAMVLSLVHGKEKGRFLRTLFYLCLPQVLCESLRIQSIRWLFVRTEQLACFLLCEGVLVYYAVRQDPRRFRSWLPALEGLLVCGLVIIVEFALENKISFGGKALPHWLLYAVMATGLASMAAAEHLGRKGLHAKQ